MQENCGLWLLEVQSTCLQQSYELVQLLVMHFTPPGPHPFIDHPLHLKSGLSCKLPSLLIDASVVIKHIDGRQVVALARLEIIRVVGRSDLQENNER